MFENGPILVAFLRLNGKRLELRESFYAEKRLRLSRIALLEGIRSVVARPRQLVLQRKGYKGTRQSEAPDHMLDGGAGA